MRFIIVGISTFIVYLAQHPLQLVLFLVLVGLVVAAWLSQQKKEMEASDKLRREELGRGRSIWDD